MRKRLGVIMCVLVFVISFGLATSANAYDLAGDWSTSTNNPAPWSYGKYDSGLDPTTFSLLTAYRDLESGSLSEWWMGGDADPNIVKNITSSDLSAYGIEWHANQVTFGPYMGPTVARWTAPSAGTFQVDAVFATVQEVNSAPNAYVYDGTILNDLGLVPVFGVGSVEYHETLTVLAGQTIDFVVWGANRYNKTTEVSASVTNVPEPATLLLLGAGIIGLVGFRRKFNKK